MKQRRYDTIQKCVFASDYEVNIHSQSQKMTSTKTASEREKTHTHTQRGKRREKSLTTTITQHTAALNRWVDKINTEPSKKMVD